MSIAHPRTLPRRAWLGIDPGASGTGLTLRARGARYCGHAVVHNPGGETALGVGPQYLAAIRREAEALLAWWTQLHPDAGDAGVAVEAVVAPGGFDLKQRRGGQEQAAPRFVRPKDVMGLAFVQGGVLAMFPDALIVPDNAHGTAPLCSYPVELVTDRERAHPHRLGMNRPAGKSSDVNHARSAWDVVRTAELLTPLTATY